MKKFFVTLANGLTGWIKAADEVAAHDYIRICLVEKNFKIEPYRGQITDLGNLAD